MGTEGQGAEGRGPRIRVEGRGSRNTNTFMGKKIIINVIKIKIINILEEHLHYIFFDNHFFNSTLVC